MNDVPFHLFFWAVFTFIAGVLGMMFGPGFHPWCWYGLLFGIAISAGVPCLMCLID